MINHLCNWWPCETYELEKTYREDLQRDLNVDADGLRRGMELRDSIDSLDVQNESDQLPRFLTNLGQSKGFNYMLAIATLAELAGQEETLIHRLSIHGKEVFLESEDEGHLKKVTLEHMVDKLADFSKRTIKSDLRDYMRIEAVS